MIDFLPFPSFRGKTTPERVEEITEYLVRLKKDLDFVLSNISEENLSPELREKIKQIQKTENERGE